MRFRTEIEQPRGSFEISHSDRILMLGSCFSDNIGEQLRAAGFDVMVNPFGPLYNPVTLARMISYLACGKRFFHEDFTSDSAGVSHCLDFAMRYQDADPAALAARINGELDGLRRFYDSATVVCITFGSAYVFRKDGVAVGNCHKLPPGLFETGTVEPDEICSLWRPLLSRMRETGKNVILTVSPIRHLAYGLHGNESGKARLLLACDGLTELADYFPSYEIMMDDLRDYRFYAADMKHPSPVAVEYIYEVFGRTYFSRSTSAEAIDRRKATAAAAHRQILRND